MKSVRKDAEIDKSAPYPKLMISGCIIVIMTDHKRGVVVSDEDGIWKVGTDPGMWNMESFTDYHGEVTLSND